MEQGFILIQVKLASLSRDRQVIQSCKVFASVTLLGKNTNIYPRIRGVVYFKRSVGDVMRADLPLVMRLELQR